MTSEDYYYIVIIIIIILLAFFEIDFVRATSMVILASKDFWPVGSVTADSTMVVLFAPLPTPFPLHTHTRPLLSTYTTTFGGINLFYFSSKQDDDNRFRRRRPW